MRVTKPMIERAARALSEAPPHADLVIVAEVMLRAALNAPSEPHRPLEGQTAIAVIDGQTVVADG